MLGNNLLYEILFILLWAKEVRNKLAYWGTFCEGISHDPTKEINWFTDMEQCKTFCLENPDECRSVSYQQETKICHLYDTFTYRVIASCSKGLAPTKIFEFFLRIEENEDLIPMDNVAIFKIIRSHSSSDFSGKEDNVCFQNPPDNDVVDGELRYDIDIFEGEDCEKFGTYFDEQPWINVDLQRVYTVEEVVLYNTAAGHESLLHDIEIRVGMLSAPMKLGSDIQPTIQQDEICAKIVDRLVPAGPNVYNCPTTPAGRYVTVQIMNVCKIPGCRFKFNKIALVEIEVWVHPVNERNVAFFKPVVLMNQTSNTGFSTLLKLVDGLKSKHRHEIGNSQAFQVEGKTGYPMFYIDLLDVFTVEKIYIYLTLEDQAHYFTDLDTSVGSHTDLMSKNEACLNLKKVPLRPSRVEMNCVTSLVGSKVFVKAYNRCLGTPSSCEPQPERFTVSEMEVIGSNRKVHDDLVNVALKRAAMQSSTLGEAKASLAVDGNARFDFMREWKPQCTSTTFSELYPWWRVDLGVEYFVAKVIIYNRKTESYYLHDYTIQVGYLDISDFSDGSTTFYKNAICVEVLNKPAKRGRVEHVCDQVTRGKYVSIQIIRNCTHKLCRMKDKNTLSLCEVIVMGANIPNFDTPITNIGYGGMTTSLSSKNNDSSGADLTMDGRVAVYSYDEKPVCASTLETGGKDKFPWWKAESVDEFMVTKVVLYVRDYFHDAEIRVGFEDIANLPTGVILNTNSVCAKITTMAQPGAVELECIRPLTGRFISIQIVDFCNYPGCQRDLNVLMLCEVRVLGFPLRKIADNTLTNEALHRPTSQSSTFKDARSGIAVDGVRNAVAWNGNKYTCSQTNPKRDHKYPWWMVDMILEVKVFMVDISRISEGELDNLHDFDIRVGNEDISGYPFETIFLQNDLCFEMRRKLSDEAFLRYTCYSPVTGRFLSIQIVKECQIADCIGNTLYLCEVFVWGKKILKTVKEDSKNIALSQHTEQSSTVTDSKLAVDGFEILPYGDNQIREMCAMTKVEAYAWWQLQFDSVYSVYAVAIFYREANLPDPQHDLEIRVGNESIKEGPKNQTFDLNPLCVEFQEDYVPQALNKLLCNKPLSGIFVTIQALPTCGLDICNKENVALILCEVKIFGIKHNPA